MIFRQHAQVLDGTKTQTRRPVRNEWMITDRLWTGTTDYWAVVQTVYEGSGICRIKWQVGRTYAVQPGRGKKAVGRIRITKIRRERLQEIKMYDAVAEGITRSVLNRFGELDSVEIVGEFALLWSSIYHHKPYRWQDNPEVWVLDFERSEG